MKIIKKVAVVLLSFCLIQCGGGGGGGSSSGSSGHNSSASTGVRILHGAIDAPPLDLYRGAAISSPLDTTAFAQASFYSSFGEGPTVVVATKAKTPTEIIASIPLTLASHEHKSLLLYGDKATFGLQSVLIDDAPGSVAEGSSAVKVVHSLVGAGALKVVIDSAVVANAVQFGEASSYVTVSSGPHTFSLYRVSDGALVYSDTKSFENRRAYTVLGTGEVGTVVVAPLYED